jgi:ADP-heptose:LPS heptosyltransferase
MAELARILVIKLSAFGDFAAVMGPFRAIRDYHPRARITLLTTPPFEEWAKMGGWFDEVWTNGRPKSVPGFLKLVKQTRAAHFDRVYDLQTNGRTNLLYQMLRPNTPEWSGVAWGASHPHANPRRDYIHGFKAKREQLLMAGIANVPDTDSSWTAKLPVRFNIPKPYALLVPGAAAHRPGKRWPVERFAALASALSSRGFTPVVIGSELESPLADAIKNEAPDTLSLTGKTTFADLAVLGRDAALAVGNDTGPMHLFATTGCPMLVLFGADSSPEMSAPHGAHVRSLQAKPISNLTVEQALNALPQARTVP